MIDFEEEGRLVLASADAHQWQEETTMTTLDFPAAARRAISPVAAVDDREQPGADPPLAEDPATNIVIARARASLTTEGVWMQHEPVRFVPGDNSFYCYVG